MVSKSRWHVALFLMLTGAASSASAQEMSVDEIRARIDAQIEARRQAGEAARIEPGQRSIRINNSQDYNEPLYGAGTASPAPSGGGARPKMQEQPLEFRSIQFHVNSHRLTESSLLTIGGIAEALRRPEYRGNVFAIVGHTDASGSDAYNLALSHKRAVSVATALTVAQVPAERLRPLGMGENALKPGVTPTDPANRRVEIVVAQ